MSAGLSDIALRGAARNDGWIGDLITTDRAIERVDRLRELRAESGLSMDDFTILTPLTDASPPSTTSVPRRVASPGSSRCPGCSTPAAGVARREDRRLLTQVSARTSGLDRCCDGFSGRDLMPELDRGL
jgi:hypothetical protein